jgi:outer membrane immunogenic protein
MRIMNTTVSGIMIMATMLLGSISTHAQTEGRATPQVAVTYVLERAQIATVGCDCFWLQGGSGEFAMPVSHGFSVAANVTGGHASNIQPGVDLSKLTYVAGPRFTFNASRLVKSHRSQIFGEALFGGAHGFDSVFPAAGAPTPTANSFAMQIGGGLDVSLPKHFGLRVLDIDYVRTSLPNNGSNTQDDLRLGFGLVWHIAKL